MVSKIDEQLKSPTFDGSDPIKILSFLLAFQTACDANGIHEGAAMWLYQKFLRRTIKAALSARVTTKED